jgi:hypothetical protein
MQSDHRREVIERIFTEAEARGTPVDGDLAFRGWVEEWIVGAIDVTELRRRYAELCGNRLIEKRARRAEPVRHEQTIGVPDDLLSEIKRLTDTFEASNAPNSEDRGTNKDTLASNRPDHLQ